MENQNKYLLLARRAREEDNAEDASKYYDLVRTEDPNNAEAKFFYSYYRMFSDTKGHAFINFINFCKGVNPTISMIMASDDSEKKSETEKKSFLKTIITCIEDTYNAALSANRDTNGGHGSEIRSTYSETMNALFSKIMGTYGDDVDLLVAQYKFKNYELKPDENPILNRYKLGDEIESKYASVPELLKLAVDFWKKSIADQQTYYNTADAKKCAGMAEKYAEKIKKYEPAYVIPKKAGCVTIGK